jgi:hypothetical protein
MVAVGSFMESPVQCAAGYHAHVRTFVPCQVRLGTRVPRLRFRMRGIHHSDRWGRSG